MKQKQPTREETAARAYQIYIERGRLDGHDLDDWLQAEYELLQLPVREIVKLPVAKPPATEPLTPKPAAVKRKHSSVIELVHQAML